MKKRLVEITGLTPLLMHNPAVMRRSEGGKKQIPTPEDEAAASRYLMPGSPDALCITADHVHSGLKAASRGFRITGRKQVYPYICGSLEIQPDHIPLLGDQDRPLTAYEVDARRVVVQKNGVTRGRAKVWPWRARFDLIFDEDAFTDKFIDGVLREQIWNRAGRAIGLLEYRPGRGGRFGRFAITRWED